MVDSNVILDVMTQDPIWYEWSLAQLNQYQESLLINQIIYTEISVGFNDKNEVDKLTTMFKRVDISYEACFLAGKAFRQSKKLRREAKSILPDFYIGAHAEVLNIPLVTRDKHYKKYFPNLQLIAPK